MKTMRFLLFIVGVLGGSQAMAQHEPDQADIGFDYDGTVLVVRDHLLFSHYYDYNVKLCVVKTGQSGSLKSCQGSVISKIPPHKAGGNSVSLNIQPGDHVEASLIIMDGDRVIYEKKNVFDPTI